MKLGKKLTRVKEAYFILQESDWNRVSPAEVLQVEGIGEETLFKLRVYLAHRGVSLRGDLEPEYWLNVKTQRDSGADLILSSEFTVLIDVNEQYPFNFVGALDHEDRPVNVRTRREALWPKGMADYTIEGYEKDIQIERKADDLAASLSAGRVNFENEIARLDGMCEFAAIVCEHDWRILFDYPPEHGASIKAIHRTWISWSIRYPNVHWFFCKGREHAEVVCWSLLQRAYGHITHRRARDAYTLARLKTLDPFSSLEQVQ